MTGTVEVKPSFRPASPAAIADSAFELFRRAPLALLLLSALGNLPLIGALAGLLAFVRIKGFSWGDPSYFVVLGLISIAVGLCGWLRAIVTGALLHASVRAVANEKVSAAGSLWVALRFGASLGVVCALRLMTVVVGLACCGIPGVAAYGALALAPAAVVVEELSVSDALLRSIKLGPRAARGLFASALLGMITPVVAFLELLMFAQLAVMLLGLLVPGFPKDWLARPEAAWVALALAKTFTDPFVSAATALAWLDGRIRAEGLDLELRSQLLAGEKLGLTA